MKINLQVLLIVWIIATNFLCLLHFVTSQSGNTNFDNEEEKSLIKVTNAIKSKTAIFCIFFLSFVWTHFCASRLFH